MIIGSKVVQHRYLDEDFGKMRKEWKRQVKRREDEMWRREALEDMEDWELEDE